MHQQRGVSQMNEGHETVVAVDRLDMGHVGIPLVPLLLLLSIGTTTFTLIGIWRALANGISEALNAPPARCS
jgi:hypothetical protein